MSTRFCIERNPENRTINEMGNSTELLPSRRYLNMPFTKPHNLPWNQAAIITLGNPQILYHSPIMLLANDAETPRESDRSNPGSVGFPGQKRRGMGRTRT